MFDGESGNLWSKAHSLAREIVEYRAYNYLIPTIEAYQSISYAKGV
jgi:hypothetical protein